LVRKKLSDFLSFANSSLHSSPTHRTSILSEFRTHVLRLLLHREASQIISDAFELYSNASDRSILLRDFYGKEVALFGDSDGKSGGLEEVLKGADEERRKRVLGALKENLINMYGGYHVTRCCAVLINLTTASTIQIRGPYRIRSFTEHYGNTCQS
jgi:pumilio family protein 6